MKMSSSMIEDQAKNVNLLLTHSLVSLWQSNFIQNKKKWQNIPSPN